MKKQNKQDWKKDLDNIRKNFRLQHKSGEYYETDLLVELENSFKKQLTEAREGGRKEGAKGLAKHLTFDKTDSFALKETNDYIRAGLVEYLKSLEGKK